MTNREALNVIADMCNALQLHPNSRQGEAMMMAINSLKNGTLSIENKGDLISRQAVDDVIYDYSRSCDVNYAQIMEYIDKIPSVENKGEWIPVSERLPEKNIWVLVTVEQSGKRFQEIMRRNNYIEAWTDNIDNYTDEITAWMPLPDPYKAEKDGET